MRNDDDDFSGNIRLRLPTDLHARLSELAEASGVSLNTLMVALLAEGAARRSNLGAGARPEIAEALAEAVLDSVHLPTRKGQLIARLDARQPDWRMWIPARRLAALRSG
jgi:hypothetical protein